MLLTLLSEFRTGLLDYDWVEYFDNTSALFRSWDDSASYPGDNTLFLALPISPRVAPEGSYIPHHVLIRDVLPFVRKYFNYRGVIIFPYLHHSVTYSEIISAYVINKFYAAI